MAQQNRVTQSPFDFWLLTWTWIVTIVHHLIIFRNWTFSRLSPDLMSSSTINLQNRNGNVEVIIQSAMVLLQIKAYTATKLERITTIWASWRKNSSSSSAEVSPSSSLMFCRSITACCKESKYQSCNFYDL